MHNDPETRNLPTPNELAKVSKDNMVKISLRIKESTEEFFKACAERSDTKPSTLMNNLLDFYANQYAHEIMISDDQKVEIIKRSLAKAADIVPRTDEELLIGQLCRDRSAAKFYGAMNTEEAYIQYLKYTASWDDMRDDEDEDSEPDEITFELGDTPFVELACTYEGASVKPKVEIFQSNDNHYNYRIQIPADKWIIAAGVANRYMRKMHELFPKVSTSISKNLLNEMAEKIYAAENSEEVANVVARILADFVEQING